MCDQYPIFNVYFPPNADRSYSDNFQLLVHPDDVNQSDSYRDAFAPLPYSFLEFYTITATTFLSQKCISFFVWSPLLCLPFSGSFCSLLAISSNCPRS